jgi:predicted RNA-binding protein with PUA-like domain
MAYWLFKSEPNNWSWEDHKKTGKQGRPVKRSRNHLANKHLKQMAKGDKGFFYHSVNEKRVVGIVEVVREYYPDENDPTGRFGVVDVVPVQDMPKPVELKQIKAEPACKDMVLVNNSRLSIQPVSEAEWQTVCRLGGIE